MSSWRSSVNGRLRDPETTKLDGDNEKEELSHSWHDETATWDRTCHYSPKQFHHLGFYLPISVIFCWYLLSWVSPLSRPFLSWWRSSERMRISRNTWGYLIEISVYSLIISPLLIEVFRMHEDILLSSLCIVLSYQRCVVPTSPDGGLWNAWGYLVELSIQNQAQCTKHNASSDSV